MELKKRTMDEMITHFNKVVSEMNIPRKDKMTLLGMITAIGYEAQNAADVAPVRHGRWVTKKDACGRDYTICSACETEIKWRDRRGVMLIVDMQNAPYCPSCGALMDKDGDGE